MYGEKSSSLPQKGVIVAAEIGLVVAAYFILFGDLAISWRAFGVTPEPARNATLFVFNMIVVARFMLTLFVFLRRKIPLEETFSVPFAFALYLVGFPLMARGAEVSTNWVEVVGIVSFASGSALNTVGEWQRHRFKQRPDTKGKLFTGGLFSLSMHVNYFGDMLWVVGYACVTRNPYAALVPAFLFAFFYWFNIPKLDAYLAARYGEQFEEYSRKTKRFIPFIL